MKDLFVQPEIEIISYENVDIICASPVKPENPGVDVGVPL